MRYLLNAEQMRRADSHTIQDLHVPSIILMERAASACVDYMVEHGWSMDHVCIVCGSGNNGGDGFAIGRILCEMGHRVTAIFAGSLKRRTEETVYQMKQFEAFGGTVQTEWKEDDYSVVVDALFGVGLSRPMKGRYLEIIRAMNQVSGKKLAVDIPSGVAATTGVVLGEAFRADATVTFQEWKLGLILYPGRDYAGEVVTADIGIDSTQIQKEQKVAYALEADDAARMLPKRPDDSHKGDFGKLLLIAGSKGMAGAAYLSAYAAYRAGAGLVRIYTCEENRAILQQQLPEAIITTYRDFQESNLSRAIVWADVVCVGSGLGTSKISEQIVHTVLNQAEVPCVLDADAINIVARHPEWKALLKSGNYVMTPHLQELARLERVPVTEIKENRRKILDAVVNTYRLTLVQKDARTFVGGYGRQTCVNLTGNASMAKAGSGDVLAGVIAALAAQGCSAYEAAVLGVYLHGLAGDIAKKELGCYSVLARDLADRIRSAIQMTENQKAEKE